MRYLLITVLAFLLALPVAAQNFEKGLDRFFLGDYAAALREWRPLAEQGDVVAQNNLGMMYRDGKGVPQDYGEAAKWYRKAAEQGHADAQLNLGIMFYNGQGVPRNYVQAHMWFNIAATQGYVLAAVNRETLAYKMEPADVSEAHHLAREWLGKHGK